MEESESQNQKDGNSIPHPANIFRYHILAVHSIFSELEYFLEEKSKGRENFFPSKPKLPVER